MAALPLPVLGVVAAGAFTLHGTLQAERSEILKSAELAAARVERALDAQAGALAAADAAVAGLDWSHIRFNPSVRAALARLAATSGSVETLGLVDPSGRLAATSDASPPPSTDLSDRDYVRAFHRREAPPVLFVSGPAMDADGRFVDHIARARTGADPAPGGFDGGLVVAGMRPDAIERAFLQLANGTNTQIALLRSDGALLARVPSQLSPGQSNWLAGDDPTWPAIRVALGGAAPRARVSVDGSLWRGIHVSGVATLPGAPLLVLVQGDPARVLHDWLAGMAFPALGALSALVLLLALVARTRREERLERDRGALRLAAAQALQRASQQRAEFEARLRQTEKAAALGQLAAGVAHDFNNLLHAVLLGTDGLNRMAGTSAPAEVQRSVRLIERSAERGVALTRRMLDFARRDDVVDGGGFDPGPALGRALELLTHSFGHLWPITLTVPPARLPAVAGDSATFETVVINLAVNARDAMPRGGRIEISAELEGAAEAARLSSAPAVRVVVRDRGLGMDAATLARAGEAFFTTKPVGAGTGLGLSMARGFAQRVGGLLEIASESGVGTTITLRLPVVA